MRRPELFIIPVTLALVLVLVGYARLQIPEAEIPDQEEVPQRIPDFSAYTDVRKKKQDFFDFLLPMIREANNRVMAQRQELNRITGKLALGERLGKREQRFIREMAAQYKVQVGEHIDADDLDSLLVKVDIVPASLMLAQAANESAWGTSRFARNAFNFFGIWCFTPGCGITPRLRDEGMHHEVRRFDSVQDCVDYYLRIINSNRAYGELRQIRASMRAANEQITGTRLAEGLVRYSERGEAYVDEIQAMIRFNDLPRYTLRTVTAESGRG